MNKQPIGTARDADLRGSLAAMREWCQRQFQSKAKSWTPAFAGVTSRAGKGGIGLDDQGD